MLTYDNMFCIIFQGYMFCNVANKIEYESKFVDVSVAEMCL